VRFVVEVARPAQEARALWSLDVRATDQRWHDVEIDLSDFAGETLDILFSTEDLGDPLGDRAVWSHAVLRSRGGSSALARAPVRRSAIVQDLLAAGSPGIASPAVAADEPCRRRFRIPVSAGMGLDLAAQVLRDPESRSHLLGPVMLGVKVDGRSLYRRRLQSAESIITADQQLSLDDYAGRVVDLEFEFCNASLGEPVLWAERLWLTRIEETPRLTRTSGPNLLLLMVDTLRADHLGLYGYERDTSPNLDRIARDSLVIERAVAHSSWTLPSVASLLTGLSPLEHGVVEGTPLGAASETLGEAVQRAGFTTFGVSANPIIGRLEGMHRGFETFLQIPWSRAEHLNELFLDWLGGKRDARWFAYLHYVDPHATYEAPPPWRDRYTRGCRTPYTGALEALSETVNFGRDQAPFGMADIDCLRDGYDGEIRYWDDRLGRLFDSLEQSGQLEDTIVVVTSDHGEEFLEHGNLGHGFHLYDETLHVPLLIHAPARLKPERRAGPVGTLHLKQAALWLLGLAPDGSDGGPLLSGNGAAQAPVFSHTTEAFRVAEGYTDLASIRDARWKYILRPVDGIEELYDLERDPDETANRVQQEPEIRSRYREDLQEWLALGRPHSRTRLMDIDTIEKLNALGYIR
jgi:arylsulfatase A-like enzyme